MTPWLPEDELPSLQGGSYTWPTSTVEFGHIGATYVAREVDWSSDLVTLALYSEPICERGIPRISHELMAIQVVLEKLPPWLREFTYYLWLIILVTLAYTAYIFAAVKVIEWL